MISALGNGNTILLQTDADSSLEVTELQAVVTLGSLPPVDFTTLSSKPLQLSVKNKLTGLSFPLLKASLYNKGFPYSFNLLYLLTGKDSFVLTPSQELIANLAIAANDSVIVTARAGVFGSSSIFF